MGLDPISGAMLGLSGFKAYQQYKAGGEAQEAYDAQADEIMRENAYAERMGLEQQHDLTVEGNEAVSQVRSAAGGKGIRVGGSVVTLTQSIRDKVARRKALVNADVQEGARRSGVVADKYRKAGRSAKKASGLQAFDSLLTGGLMAYNHLHGKGLSGRDMLFGNRKPTYGQLRY